MSKKTSRKPKMPKDLGVKIGSEEMKLWDTVIRETESMIKQAENNLIIQREMLTLAKKKLEEATKAFEKL